MAKAWLSVGCTSNILTPKGKAFYNCVLIKEVLDELEEDVQEFEYLVSDRKKRKVATKLKRILRQGLPEEEYAATVATEILKEGSYHFVKSKIISWDYWDDDFEALERQLQKIAFL